MSAAKQINLSGINLNVNKNNNIGGNITTTDSITASGTITGNALSSKTTISAGTNISASGNITSSNDITGKNITASNGEIRIYKTTAADVSNQIRFRSVKNFNNGTPSVYGTLDIYYKFKNVSGSSNNHLNYFRNTMNGSSTTAGHYLNITGSQSSSGSWYKISTGNSGPEPSLTILHTCPIQNSLNNYHIGQPIFLSNNNTYYNKQLLDNYDASYTTYDNLKININDYTFDNTIFNITNEINNNFLGICVCIPKKIIVKKEYEDTVNKFFFYELTDEQYNSFNLDKNNLPENLPENLINDYMYVYKFDYELINSEFPEKYSNLPVIAFATHGDYMFYVDDTEALIDTNLNTQKHYEVGDELTYDGKILILPEFNPDENTTELNQLQQLLNYNKQMSNYNKLKKNSIGKISHIFTQQECDDYKHYLAVFKTN